MEQQLADDLLNTQILGSRDFWPHKYRVDKKVTTKTEGQKIYKYMYNALKNGHVNIDEKSERVSLNINIWNDHPELRGKNKKNPYKQSLQEKYGNIMNIVNISDIKCEFTPVWKSGFRIACQKLEISIDEIDSDCDLISDESEISNFDMYNIDDELVNALQKENDALRKENETLRTSFVSIQNAEKNTIQATLFVRETEISSLHLVVAQKDSEISDLHAKIMQLKSGMQTLLECASL